MGPAQGHKDFLPPRWTSAVTQRLVLDVERVHTGQPVRAGGFEVGDSCTSVKFMQLTLNVKAPYGFGEPTLDL